MSLAQKKPAQESRFNLMEVGEYDRLMETRGWVVFEAVISKDLIGRMIDDIHKAYKTCRDIQVKNGIAANTEFTVHHLIGQGSSFLDYLEVMPIKPYIERYFGGNYVLNSFGGAINSAHSRSYAHKIHRDIRSFSGDMPLLLNTLVMFDDFTEANGATYLMPGAHKLAEKPLEEEFYAKAQRAIGPAGSILMFNSNLWHAGGDNNTDKPRRSVTPMFCRPFIKPGFDYCRALGYDYAEKLSPELRQIIGYNARIPASLDEWYQPPEKRMYKPDQG
jgi:ectoine hydroxylase-related dioxygenase (phytanoyl-CoA dioxygenase family)